MLALKRIHAVTLLATASFGWPALADDAPSLSPLKFSKECSNYNGETPSSCTISESSLKEIPAGTKVLYYGPVLKSPLFTSSSVVLAVGPGDSAIGYCIVYDTAKPPTGHCAFSAGSGTLAGFQAILNVTVDDQHIWRWDGGYLLAATR